MSSANNRFISNEEAVPVIKTDLFAGHEDSRFAIAVYNSDLINNYPSDVIQQAYLRFRKNVYVDQTGMLDKDVVRGDGIEIDVDDERSTHFVVIENLLGKVAVFACMRLITKNFESDVLPIEDFFPEAFLDPAVDGSVEVSRFIVRHNNARVGLDARSKLVLTSLAHVAEHNLGPIFGVVEPEFERGILGMRLPIRRIAESKLVLEYNDENLGIEIMKDKIVRNLGTEAIMQSYVPVGEVKYWGHMKRNENLEEK